MPYVTCTECGLRTYAVARYSTGATCPLCGAPLWAGSGRRPLAEPVLERELKVDIGAPAEARAALHTLLGSIGEDLIQTVDLLTTEVVANAFKHAGHDGASTISLRVYLGPGMVRVEVGDDGTGFEPQVSIELPDFDAASGRGLFLVDHMSERWGVGDPERSTVWFEVARAPH